MSYKAPRRRTSALAGGRISSMPATIPEYPSRGQMNTPSRPATDRDDYLLRDDHDYHYSKERRQEQYNTQRSGPAMGSLRSSAKTFVPTTGSSLLRQARFVLSLIIGLSFVAVLARFGESTLAWIQPLAQEWENSRYGTIAFAGLVALACNPLLFGHSSLSILGGFIFGFTIGSLLVIVATILGSILAFLFSRKVSPAFVRRLTAQDPRLRHLLALSYNGLRDLLLVRLSLAPHQLVNGLIATAADISLAKFALGSTIASVKLLVHVFVGSRLALLAKGLIGLGKVDSSTRLLCWLSILGASVIWIATGICIQFFVLKSSDHSDENDVMILHDGYEDQHFEERRFEGHQHEASHGFSFPQYGRNSTPATLPYPPT